MKRLLPSLLLAAAITAAGCKPKPPKPTQTNNNGTDLTQTQPQPQPYQGPANNTEPEPQPAPQPAPEPAPTHHQAHPSATGHHHNMKYVVKKGDTMSKIAKAHHVSLKRLEAANPKVDPNKIKVGETIMIP